MNTSRTANAIRNAFIFASLLAIVTSQAQAQLRMGSISANAMEKSVVMIRSVSQDFDYVTPWKQMTMGQGLGSGFIIEGDRILTNAHNVSNNKYIEVKKQNLAKRYPAVVTFIGHDCDLAVLAVLDQGFFSDMTALELGGIPAVNSTVQTYGFPVGGRQLSTTEGVVSRVQMGTYSHSQADAHLVVQTDAAINPGNSGGPVMQAGKVVGVAFQGLRAADNIGYMIPTTVIHHFLADIADGKYHGFGSLGFTFFPGLHSKSYARYLKVPADTQGIVILNTMMHSSVENIFQRNDVITKVDDYSIDNDGMVTIYGLSIHMSEVIEQKQIGDTVDIAFYRDGELVQHEATVALNRPILAYDRQYDVPPRYVVYAGLTFVPVTRNYLEVWGSSWLADMPFYLRYLFFDSERLNTDCERKEYVVLSEILPDEVNSYSSGFEDQVVDSVNGTPIRRLSDLPQALTSRDTGFLVIKFMGMERPLVLDAEKAEVAQHRTLEKYNVPSATNLEEQI
ncbi:MAG: trypsin-like peptidase domain-containing protein [Planctomycetes bacterium]|nr:trypsin-like peptidase domain-containing protein [Planctomycetota bacterium]